MMHVSKMSITPTLAQKVPGLVCGVMQCEVSNTGHSEQLWREISSVEHLLLDTYEISEIKNRSTIRATRQAYKSCGKDPNRYRPSAEQLCRRILQGKGLYHISTLVDLVNLVSLKSGFSIGGFDLDKVKGDLNYGIGEEGEFYRGIGRGELNIQALPVLRDEVGGIGTPTSDEERTQVALETKHILLNINDFGGESAFLQETIEWMMALLVEYVDAKNIQIDYFKSLSSSL